MSELSDILRLDPVLENSIRLGIMSVLMARDSEDFSSLKSLLEVSDGKLATHIKSLEKAGYITISKKFIGLKPNTSYAATPKGRAAFNSHLESMEAFLKNR